MIFDKTSIKENLAQRNRIFLDAGLPSLQKRGFEVSPFQSSWFGRNNLGDFTYEFCRLDSKFLNYITVEIIRDDPFIQIYLNIFILSPKPDNLLALKEMDGIGFHLPPCARTKFRLKFDDQKFSVLPREKYQLKRFRNKSSYEKRAEDLRQILEKDMLNINDVIKSWFDRHTPFVTDWDGNLTS